MILLEDSDSTARVDFIDSRYLTKREHKALNITYYGPENLYEALSRPRDRYKENYDKVFGK